MRSTIAALSKRIVIPKLSPTHTSARVVRFLCPIGTSVEEYQPFVILECSSDLIADPADRQSPNHKPLMLLETLEEGTLMDLDDSDGKWMDVGSYLGVVYDGDDIDGDWTWQAYLHEEGDDIS
mmetsp:Transcript_16000/g.34806  ORF Transcript_16000/g.34806 Transcript_16000/m.34806 type:complete len:123 (-) Transcript_16000:26-394(-)